MASPGCGNLMLVVLNLPLIGFWERLVSGPYRVQYVTVIGFSAIGV